MDLRLLLRLAVALALGALVAWLAALTLTLPSGSVAAAVVLRTVLVGLILVLLTRILMRRAYAGDGLVGRAVLAGLLGYALFPGTWAGRALAGQLLLDPGPVTAALDLVLWLALVGAAASTAQTRGQAVEPAPYQRS